MSPQDNRLRATMGLMARDNDNEAIVALRQATRMLAGRGLDWASLAELAIGGAGAAPTETRAKPRAEPRPEPKPKPTSTSRTAVIGTAIPQRIEGLVMLLDRERTSSGGTMTTFAIYLGNMVYGPIVAYTSKRADTLRKAAETGAIVAIDLLTPGEGRRIARMDFSLGSLRWRNVTFMPQAGNIMWLS